MAEKDKDKDKNKDEVVLDFSQFEEGKPVYGKKKAAREAYWRSFDIPEEIVNWIVRLSIPKYPRKPHAVLAKEKILEHIEDFHIAVERIMEKHPERSKEQVWEELLEDLQSKNAMYGRSSYNFFTWGSP